MTISPGLADWLRDRHQAVLVTLKQDGSAQSSNVVFAFDGELARVSVTADRAKTHNSRRDPRVVLHVLGDDFWQYAAITASAAVSEVTTEAGDATGLLLLDVYEAVAGKPHPDRDEFFAAMVQEQRCVLSLTLVSAAGWNAPA